MCSQLGASSALLVLALATSAVASSSPCPPSAVAVTVAGVPSQAVWCIQTYNFTASFCDAVRICHKNRQELISRRVFESMRVRSDFFVHPGWWVGLTDAGNERNTSKDGWVWILDGHLTTAADNVFADLEPNNLNGNQDCVVSYSSGLGSRGDILLRDATCTELNSVYCYFNSNLAVSTMSSTAASPQTQPAEARFVKSNATVSAFYKNFNAALEPMAACWHEAAATSKAVTGAVATRSSILCSQRCLKLRVDCLGFYWNPHRLECVVISGYDSVVLLPNVNAWELLAWEKFLRV